MRRKAFMLALSFLPHAFFSALTCWGMQGFNTLFFMLLGFCGVGVLIGAFMQLTAYVADALKTYPGLFRSYGLPCAEEAPNAFVIEGLALMVFMWWMSSWTLIAIVFFGIHPAHSFTMSLAVVGMGALMLLDTKPS